MKNTVIDAMERIYEERGCTCFLGHHPCWYCENAPDPDSEDGLRRELHRISEDLFLARKQAETLRQLLKSHSPMPEQSSDLRSVIAGRDREIGDLKRTNAAQTERIKALEAQLDNALGGKLRSPEPEQSRIKLIEIDP